MRWFKHLTNSHDDEKLADLIGECGLEAYGFWWRLLEIVASNMGKDDEKCSALYPLSRWAALLYCHHNTVGKYLGKLEVRGMVRVRYGEGMGYSKVEVIIPNLLKYRDEYSKKSRHNPDNIRPKIEIEKEIQIQSKEESKEIAVPVKPSRPARVPKLSDDEWMNEVRNNAAYADIDIDRELGKCQAWCSNKGKQMSRGRILNWLNGAEKPFKGNVLPIGNRPITFGQAQSEGNHNAARAFAGEIEDDRTGQKAICSVNDGPGRCVSV